MDAPFRRWCDVAVIGGSAAGLAGALMLARSRRSVIVIDSGEPRNAPAAHMHGYLGYEGRAPADLLAAGRSEVRSYGAEVLDARVHTVDRDGDRFRIALHGAEVTARSVLVATGATDRLPELDGLADHWGSAVIHCPYCHGWEVRGRRVVVLATNGWAAHQAGLFRQLTDDLAVVIHDDAPVDADTRAALEASTSEIIDGPARRVLSGPDGRLEGIELVDGTVIAADAIVVSTRVEARADFLAPLGIEPKEHPSGIGTAVEVDAMGATAVPGVYAAGNVADPSLQVLLAAAAGSRTGALINAHLVAADRLPHDETIEWDRRYGSAEQIWSGNPNGTLVAEVRGMSPGRALDVGCGEGGDAVWLAEQGWKVTALDVSSVALERVAAAAGERGLDVALVCADLPGAGLAAGAFDLVSVQYPSIPRTPEGEAIDAMLELVAPGGTLLVVGHAFDPAHAHDHVRPFDPQAFVQPDDVAARLDPRQWNIEAHAPRARPGGHTDASPHHHGVVVRATRAT